MDTVYSLSGDVPYAEMLPEDPEQSVLQPGSVVAGCIRQVCQIRKISAGGAILTADLDLAEGRRLELELETGERLEGAIAWRKGQELGLRFYEPIDILPILARNLVCQPGERRRMPRVEVSCRARLETENVAALVRVHDIAQGGIKIDGPVPLTPGQSVTIEPEGLRRIDGQVRWSNGALAGLSFEPEISWQELMPWLRGRRQPAAAMPSPLIMATAAQAPTAPPVPTSPMSESVQLSLPARVRDGTRRWRIDVSSLTARGVQFDCFAALRLGSLLWIVLPGLEGWPARIVAMDGSRFTCEFTQPLHPAVLERILEVARTSATTH